MRKLIYILIILITISFSAGCTMVKTKENKDNITLVLATSSPEDTVTQIFAEKFSEEVYSLSKGSIEVKVYANGVLGGDKEIFESCIYGDISFVVQNTAPQTAYVKEAAIFDVPAAYMEIEGLRKTLDNETFIDAIQPGYLEEGVRLLTLADQGFRVMTSNKRITSYDQFKGQKVRTMENSNHVAFWQAIGANSTPMAFSEVYIGLQQKTIDAQENPVEVIVSSKFYEQQEYMIETNHLPHIISLVVNEDMFQELSKEQQQAINEAATIATEYSRKQSDLRNDKRIDDLKDNGVEVIPISEGVHREIREASVELYNAIRGQVGDELMNLYLKGRE